MSAQRRSATKRKQSGKRSGRSAQPVPKTPQAPSVGGTTTTTAVTRERTVSTTAGTRERSGGTTVTYRPREAPEVVTKDAAPAAESTGRGARTSSSAGGDRRQRSGLALADQPKRKLLALDRFRGFRGGSVTPPAAAPTGHAARTSSATGGYRRQRSGSALAEQPKRKLIALDRFRGSKGETETAPANAASVRRGSRVEAEQPRRRTLVNTDRFDGVRRFSRETWSEIKKVNWPDRETTRNLTLVVIAVSAILGVMLGGIDFVLFQLFEALP